MRVLITGVSGFAGRWLARELAKDRTLELYGVSRTKPGPGSLPKSLKFTQTDLSDRAAVRKILQKIRPDRIHHLAGQASVALSWKNPEDTRRQNVGNTRILLETLEKLQLRPVLHIAGSAEVYGRQKAGKIRESARLSPRNPYARSKKEQEKLAAAYARRTQSPLVITRAFNHAGPEQKERFALSDFARQIARIERGQDQPVLWAGNLSAVRDFTDVRDVVRAYAKTAKTAEGISVYNVATGRARTLESVVRRLAASARVKVRVQRDPARVRAEDLPRLVGDPAKIRRAAGWSARIPLDRTLRDTLQYWRKKGAR